MIYVVASALGKFFVAGFVILFFFWLGAVLFGQHVEAKSVTSKDATSTNQTIAELRRIYLSLMRYGQNDASVITYAYTSTRLLSKNCIIQTANVQSRMLPFFGATTLTKPTFLACTLSIFTQANG